LSPKPQSTNSVASRRACGRDARDDGLGPPWPRIRLFRPHEQALRRFGLLRAPILPTHFSPPDLQRRSALPGQPAKLLSRGARNSHRSSRESTVPSSIVPESWVRLCLPVRLLAPSPLFVLYTLRQAALVSNPIVAGVVR